MAEELIKREYSDAEADEIRKLAATGISARQIAVSMELEPERAAAFVFEATIPGSPTAVIIEQGRAMGVSAPQLKLQAAAAAGNIDAIKTLGKIQEKNRFKNLLANMDDDEIAF